MKESRIFHTSSEEETIELGRRLAPELYGAVLLIGNLGAGKTTLAKGIVEGRAVASRDDVSSPTFTLVHQYGEPGAALVFHVDLYRLDEQREVENAGPRRHFLEWFTCFAGVGGAISRPASSKAN